MLEIVLEIAELDDHSLHLDQCLQTPQELACWMVPNGFVAGCLDLELEFYAGLKTFDLAQGC